MLWRTMFPSAYIAADDLPEGREFTWHISAVVADDVQKVNDRGSSRKERKLIISFSELDAKAKKEGGEPKRYIPCKTVAKLIARAYGPETDAWIGKPVTVFREILPQSFGEKNVPAIRARIPEGQP
jgi:hypothetical protein